MKGLKKILVIGLAILGMHSLDVQASKGWYIKGQDIENTGMKVGSLNYVNHTFRVAFNGNVYHAYCVDLGYNLNSDQNPNNVVGMSCEKTNNTALKYQFKIQRIIHKM